MIYSVLQVFDLPLSLRSNILIEIILLLPLN
jgi:hypothetical protein